MKDQELLSDGVWRPEMAINHRWVPTRYIIEGMAARRRRRYEDGGWVGGDFMPAYFDSLDECRARCDHLNEIGNR